MKTILKTITRFLKREQGFTLVEMVTVVAIMGVMAAVAVPMVSSQIGKARDKSYLQDKAMIQTAVDSFFTDADNFRFRGLRQYPILGNINSKGTQNVLAAEDRPEFPELWEPVDEATPDSVTPQNPLRGTKGGNPKWRDGIPTDDNRELEDGKPKEATGGFAD
ncbi:MAG: type II secretion system protein, partial [Chloroflexi bacterium]|nr:type II secretion system protein [Chloroflexota bacterium]